MEPRTHLSSVCTFQQLRDGRKIINGEKFGLKKWDDSSQVTQWAYNKACIWIHMHLSLLVFTYYIKTPLIRRKQSSRNSRCLRCLHGRWLSWGVYLIYFQWSTQLPSASHPLLCPAGGRKILISWAREAGSAQIYREKVLFLKSLQAWPLSGYLTLLCHGRHVVELINIFFMFSKELNAQL